MTGAVIREERSTLSAWYLTFIVFLSYMVGQIDRQVIVMLAGEMKQTLQFSDEQLGFLLGLGFFATYAIGAIVFAQLAEQRGRKKVLLAGIILWSVATAACALVKSFEGLVVTRLLVGLGEGSLAPAALPMVSAVFSPKRRSFPLAFVMSGASVGLIIAPAATGWILQVMQDKEFGPYPVFGFVYGWQTAFLIAGAVGIVVGLLLLTLREPRRPQNDSGEANTMTFGKAYRHFARHLRFYLAIFAAAPLTVAPSFALIAWVPAHLDRTFTFGPELIGSRFGASFLPSMILGPIFGGLAAHFAARLSHQRAYFDVLLALLIAGSIAMALPMPTSNLELLAFSIVCVFQFVIMSVG